MRLWSMLCCHGEARRIWEIQERLAAAAVPEAVAAEMAPKIYRRAVSGRETLETLGGAIERYLKAFMLHRLLIT